MSDRASAHDKLAPIGQSTMSPAMRTMSHYPRYLLARVAPCLGQRVIEIGIGNGQYTRALLEQGRSVLATDIDPQCLQDVQSSLGHDPRVTFAPIDLNDADTIQALKSFQADSILCLNVLEHIRDDVAALAYLRSIVTPGAHIGLIVPAHRWLYGQMDREAGHYRRYTRSMLKRALTEAGWQVEKTVYLNALGALGWFYHNRIRTKAGLADRQVNNQMQRIDRWLPVVAKVTDPVLGRIVGLSVLAIASSADRQASPSEVR